MLIICYDFTILVIAHIQLLGNTAPKVRSSDWREAGDTASDLTDLVFELQTSRTNGNVLTAHLTIGRTS